MTPALDKLKKIIMTTINGLTSPSVTASQAAQNAAKSAMAEAKYIAEMTKIVVPQQTSIMGEIKDLEIQKATKESEKTIKENEVLVIDTNINIQQNILNLKKKTESLQKKYQDKALAKAKARGETYNSSSNNPDNEIRELKRNIDEQQRKSKELHNSINVIKTEINDIQQQIYEKQKTIRFLAAQLNPTASLTEAKIKTKQAQSKVDSAQTPEIRELAQKELDEAQSDESTIQSISEDYKTAMENTETQNEPKMMQLRAEYQIMDSGINVLKNLITNLPTLGTSIMTVPSTIVAGSATGVANPALAPLWGNVLYGYAYFILATVKAASIRFLALAQELEYTPTSEMTIINMIAPTEISLKNIMVSLPAPAGATLI